MEQKTLLIGDVDAIQEFVFETSSLPQIRGGSQLLLECEDEVAKKVEDLGGEKIHCSGGSFLFEIPSNQVETAREAIEKIYLDHTLTATVTVAFESGVLPPDLPSPPQNGWANRLWAAHQQAQQSGDFARQVAFLGAQIRQRKSQKTDTPFLETFPFGKRCERCGKRLAIGHEPVEGGKALCAVCWRRDQKGRSKEQEIRGKFNQEFWTLFAAREGFRARQSQDLDTLVRGAKRTQLAFLYADGNDIGGLLQQAASKDEYSQISEAVREGTKEALFQAVVTVCGSTLRKENTCWPFDIINVGGDDVTVLIQPGYAWELAVEFLKNFEAEINRRLPGRVRRAGPVTASAGIVVADVKHPVRYLAHLAGDLLKRAKKVAKADSNNPQSAVTFLWLPNPIATEKAEPLMAYYKRNDNEILTARPYTLDRAEQLTGLVEQASQWPRSLRYRWGEALEHGMWVSLNTVYYDIARKKKGERARLAHFLSQVSNLAVQQQYQASPPGPLWQSYQEGKQAGWRTALLDVLELAELRAMRSDVREEEER